MSRSRISFCILLALCGLHLFSAIARAQDEAPPPTRRVVTVPPRKGWHLVNGIWLRASGSCAWPDLLHFAWRGDQLAAAVEPATKCAALFAGDRRAAIEVGSDDDLYEIELHELPRGKLPPELGGGFAGPRMEGAAGRGLFLIAHQMNESRADGKNESNSPLRPRSIVAAPDVLRINCRGLLDGHPVSITFNGTPEDTQLIITIDGADTSMRAPTLAQLQREHPIEVRRYLSPLLRCIRPEESGDLLLPGWADIYFVFDQIAPSQQAIEQVRRILPKLQSDDSRERNNAMNALRAQGGPAVCAMARWPVATLPAQSRLLIEQLLREQSQRGVVRGFVEPATLRRDRLFLIDCLEFADPAVRTAAIEALGQLTPPISKIDGKDAVACTRAAKQLRDETLQTTAPK